MREAFEKWWSSEDIKSMSNLPVGELIKFIAEEAWTTSRTAIEIPSSSDSEYWFEGAFQRMRYERDVEKAISSGIRIKGKI